MSFVYMSSLFKEYFLVQAVNGCLCWISFLFFSKLTWDCVIINYKVKLKEWKKNSSNEIQIQINYFDR